MVRKLTFVVFLYIIGCASCIHLFAQDSEHVNVGVFADYVRLDEANPPINFVGVGGRVGFNVHPNIQIEAEMSYDFRRNFTSTFDDGVTTKFVSTDLRPITALFGPKFQTSGPIRAFVTGKVGFINFDATNQQPVAGFTSGIGAITTGNTRFALYPGGGVEGFFGPLGLRLEVGDEIYFDNGGRNNFKVTVGPVLRF